MASRAVAVVIALVMLVPLAPQPQIVDCSRPDYRQKHLAVCNQVSQPGYRGGGGGGRGGLLGGLLGGIL